MTRIIFASLNENAGKTSTILALASIMEKEHGKKCGYMKPFGDRLLYRKKRLWDYDAALVSQVLNLGDNPEQITIGFDHAKMRYMYDELSTIEKINEIALAAERDRDMLFVESGKNLFFGASVNMDTFSLAKALNAKIVLLASGPADEIEDRLSFLKEHTQHHLVTGVIINQVEDIDDFESTNMETISKIGFDILGIIPRENSLRQLSMSQISDTMMSKVIAASEQLCKKVDLIQIGAVSVITEFKNKFLQHPNTLVITSGDRSDIILESMDKNTSGIVLTTGALPSPNIIAKATEMGIPLLAVNTNTHETAKKIDEIEPLLQSCDADKFELMQKLLKKHVKIEKIIK